MYDAQAYRRDVRARRLSRAAIPVSLGILLYLTGQTDVGRLAEYLTMGLGGAGIIGGLSYWLGDQPAVRDFLASRLVGPLFLYTTGLAVSGLGILEFEVDAMGHMVVAGGLAYLALISWFARRHFEDKIGMAVGAFLGLAIGTAALYL